MCALKACQLTWHQNTNNKRNTNKEMTVCTNDISKEQSILCVGQLKACLLT